MAGAQRGASLHELCRERGGCARGELLCISRRRCERYKLCFRPRRKVHLVVALLCLDTGRAWQSMCQRQLYGVTVCCYQQAAVVMRSVSLPSGSHPRAACRVPQLITATRVCCSFPIRRRDVSGFIISWITGPLLFYPCFLPLKRQIYPQTSPEPYPNGPWRSYGVRAEL